MDERERVAEVYDRYAADASRARAWSAANPGNAGIREELVSRALPHVEGPVLDAGCGTGWWLRRLADEGIGPLHGLDVLPERVERARALVPEAAVRAGDARDLPYADGSFATVTLWTVLSSLSGAADQRRALTEARRVLRPGGVLLAWEPRIANPRNRATTLVRRGLFAPGAVVTTLTVLPPLARRLPGRAYPLLARIPALRTHRLVAERQPARRAASA